MFFVNIRLNLLKAAVILFPKHLSTDVPLHEAAKPLQWLLGKWKGQGKGIYPTIKDFEYIEDLEFFHVGQPMLQFRYVETKKYFGFLNKWQFQKNWPISTYLYLKDVLAIRAFYFLVKSELKLKYRMKISIWIVGRLGSGWVGGTHSTCDVLSIAMN